MAVVFTEAGLATNSAGWSGWSLVMRFEPSAFTPPGGFSTADALRFTFRGPTNATQTQIANCAFGHAPASGGNFYDFDTVQPHKRQTFGGNNSIALLQNEVVPGDIIPYSWDSARPLNVAFDFTATTTILYRSVATAIYSPYQKNATGDVMTADKSGYSAVSDGCFLISQIEAFKGSKLLGRHVMSAALLAR